MTDLIAEIKDLKRDKHATILAHYYQDGEIQALADVTGDSLEPRPRRHQGRYADTIVFCGVHFMAETAKILNPEQARAAAGPAGRLQSRRKLLRPTSSPAIRKCCASTAGASRPSPTSTAPPPSRRCPTGSSPAATPSRSFAACRTIRRFCSFRIGIWASISKK